MIFSLTGAARLAALLFLVSCSHYKPISTGKGRYTGSEVTSCSHSIFNFPTSGSRRRLDITLHHNNLNEDDVFSVEERSWPYLFPLYTNSCTVISLNENGIKKAKAAEPIVVEEKESEPVKYDPEAKYSHVKSIEGCNEFRGVQKTYCKKIIRKRLKRENSKQ